VLKVHRPGDNPSYTTAMEAHAQHFLANDELLLPILKAFAQFNRSMNATRSADIFSTDMSRLTTGIRSEECVIRRFACYASVIECTYTNLDSTVQPTTHLGYMV
jgi:hypothetical protein